MFVWLHLSVHLHSVTIFQESIQLFAPRHSFPATHILSQFRWISFVIYCHLASASSDCNLPQTLGLCLLKGNEYMLCLYTVFLLRFYDTEQRVIAKATIVSLKAAGQVFLCHANRAKQIYSQGFLTGRKGRTFNNYWWSRDTREIIWSSCTRVYPDIFSFFPLGTGWQVPLRQNNSQVIAKPFSK